MDFDNSNAPTTPKDCESRDDYLSYSRPGISGAALFFLIAFCSIWTFVIGFACVSIFFDGTDAPLFAYLFLLPFIFVDIVIWLLIVYAFFGKEIGWLDDEGFHREYKCFFFRMRKNVPLDSIVKFRIGKDYSFQQNQQPAIAVEIVTKDKPLFVARSFKPIDIQSWLASTGNVVLGNLKGAGLSDFDSPDDESLSVNFMEQAELDNDEDDEDRELLKERFYRSDHVDNAEKPDKTPWKLENDFDRVEFYRRGKATGLFGLLFVTLFWNGILSVFLCATFGIIGDKSTTTESSPAVVQTDSDASSAAPAAQEPQSWFEKLKQKRIVVNGREEPIFGRTWWFMFCFLIPFEVIGALMIWGLLTTLFAPFTTQRWTFSANSVVRRRTLFGIPFTRRFDLMNLDYFEIQPNSLSSNKTTCNILLFDNNNRSILKIKDLSQDEAHWMLSEILPTV